MEAVVGIKQLPDGSYIVFVSSRHPKTKKPQNIRRSRNEKGNLIRSRAEAERVLKKITFELADRFKTIQHPLWKDIILEFLNDSEKFDRLSLNTRETYWLCLNAHTMGEWGERRINTIHSEEIVSLIKRKLHHRSQAHQKNLLKFIRAVFKFAIGKRYILVDPTPKMHFEESRRVFAGLTIDQVTIFLNKAREVGSPWYSIWATAVYTGMRNGELIALTWDKVNLSQRQIKVTCSWNNKVGLKKTKSGDERIVEIAPDLIPVLEELKRENTDTNFVLPRLEKWEKGEQARELRMFLQVMGLPQIRFHDLRATWATIMLSKGIELIRVMLMGGWKTLETMELYMRKSAVSIKGITDDLNLHNPHLKPNLKSYDTKNL